MRVRPMNADACFYSFRFVFYWNESARVSWSEAEPPSPVSRPPSAEPPCSEAKHPSFAWVLKHQRYASGGCFRLKHASSNGITENILDFHTLNTTYMRNLTHQW